MSVNRPLLFVNKKKDMKIITNIDAIISQIVYYCYFRYGSIFSFVLVHVVNRNFMFVRRLHKRWTKHNWYPNRLENAK
jgi:biopolymer transport protein ExbB/TolQ